MNHKIKITKYRVCEIYGRFYIEVWNDNATSYTVCNLFGNPVDLDFNPVHVVPSFSSLHEAFQYIDSFNDLKAEDNVIYHYPDHES